MGRPLTASLMMNGAEVKVPPAWKSPMRNKDGTKKPLFQAVVETSDGPMRVGPARVWSETEQFAHALSLAIKAGKITGWGFPTLIQVTEGVR